MNIEINKKLNKAINFYIKKDYYNAEKLIKLILQENNKIAEAWYYWALIACNFKKNVIALELINKAISLKPIEQFVISKCIILYNLEDYKELEKNSIALIKINPSAQNYSNLGVAYTRQGEFDKAIACSQEAIALSPTFVPAYNNWGLALKNKNKYEEAINYYLKGLKLNPDFVDLNYNIAICYKDTMQFDKAIEFYQKTLELNPNYSDAYLNLSIAYLLNKNFKEGFDFYEKRYIKLVEPCPSVKKPKWNGELLEGKTIYVLCEQGYGDSIQFIRFIKDLKKFGATKILFKCQEGLEQLFKESNLNIEIIKQSTPDEELNFDYYTLLLSLPYHLKINEYNIHSRTQYLKANKKKVSTYKRKYFNNNKYKIGIVWQGSPTHKGDNKRSLSLENFYPIFDFQNVQFYSLQKDYGSEQLINLPQNYNIINISESFENYSDTAAAIENLDLVITIDSSVAHLAGALGKEVWIILPEELEWRWFLDEDLTVWYSSARLFRPEFNKNRSKVIDRILEALNKKFTK